jgi:hypothetical protein
VDKLDIKTSLQNKDIAIKEHLMEFQINQISLQNKDIAIKEHLMEFQINAYWIPYSSVQWSKNSQDCISCMAIKNKNIHMTEEEKKNTKKEELKVKMKYLISGESVAQCGLKIRFLWDQD